MARQPPGAPVTEADLAALPDAVARYLNFMGVAGLLPDSSFLAHFTGRFRLRPQLPWMRCVVWQYNSSPAVARLFHMRITAAGVLPMTGRDAYVHGHGRMHGKLAGLVTVADAAGPENDVSELVTYLNDAVFFAPSMLLALPVSWAPPETPPLTSRLRTAATGSPPGSSPTSAGRRWTSAPATAGVTYRADRSAPGGPRP